MNEFILNYIFATCENGYENVLRTIINEILETGRKFDIFEYMKKEDDAQCIAYAEITYSWLVQLYGEYGVTNRSGWIEKENLPKIKEIKKYIDLYWEDEL